MLTPSGSAVCMAGRRALMPSMVAFVLAPSRFITIPATTSPIAIGLPSASRRDMVTAPWRISGPKLTSATSLTRTETPSIFFSGILPMSRSPSSLLRTQPTPRITNCSAPLSKYQPPALRLFCSMASEISFMLSL